MQSYNFFCRLNHFPPFFRKYCAVTSFFALSRQISVLITNFKEKYLPTSRIIVKFVVEKGLNKKHIHLNFLCIMKDFLLYILRTYILSVIAIGLAMYLEILCIQYHSPLVEGPFSSPVYAAVACAVIYPLLNLLVICPLYKYRFPVIEAIVESICFVNITFLLDELLIKIPSARTWIHKTIDGMECWKWENAWWYGGFQVVFYSICLTIVLCLLYMKMKGRRKNAS